MPQEDYESVLFSLTHFQPHLLSFPEFKGAMLHEMTAMGQDMYDTFKELTSTWEDHDVTFTPPSVSFAGGDASVEIKTNNEIFFYLDQGTTRRWAVMSNPFFPQTTPGSFQGRLKHGHTVIKGKQAMMKRGIGPQPGIDARGWTDMMIEDVPDEMAKRINRLIDKYF